MHRFPSRSSLRQIWIFLITLQLVFPLQLQAQVENQTLTLPAEDIIAPKVIHNPTNRGTNPNGTYFFAAEVTDDIAVQSVTLFYRTKGDQQYVAIPMTSSKPPLYTALLSPDSVRAPGIEYYIQAKDSSGNAVLVGAAFSPLSMAVLVPVTTDGKPAQTSSRADISPADEPATEEKSGASKWWWVAAGVVVVALIAGGGGGGGGGGDDPAPTPPATTGGIVITAPLPQ